jgi:phosphate transport system protein
LTIPRAIRLILIARCLERVADHATNIAEMVVYLVESRMVRHTLA